MSLPERLEQAAEALPGDADAIRPANGDPQRLWTGLGPEAAQRVLSWLFANAPDEAIELADEWLDEAGGAAVVAAIDEADLPKPGRKALRRLLHAARSRGLAVVRSEGAPSKVARLPDLEEEISAGYVSSLDPRGARLVYLLESSPAGGAHVFEALVDLERGLVDFQLYRAGRRQVRDFIRDVTRRKGGYAAVEVEPLAVRALIARAVAAHPASRPFPKPFPEWRSRLTKGAEGASTPGELAREALGSEATDEQIERLVAEIRDRAIGPWPPAPDVMEAPVQALRDRAKTAGDEAIDSLEDWTRETIHSLYPGERASVHAERFEECAYLYWRRGDEDTARACLATAAELRSGRGAEAPAVRALGESITRALTLDLKQSLGIGAGEGAEASTNQADG